MVGPQYPNDDKGERVDREQRSELLERRCIIAEREAVRNTDLEDYNRNGDANTPSEKPSIRRFVGFSSDGRLSPACEPSDWTRRSDSVMAFPIRHREAHDLALAWEKIVVCINQVDLHFVRPGRQTVYVDGIAVTGVRP